jgi:hypothetical protein
MTLFVQTHSAALVDCAPSTELACSGLGRIEFMGGGQACFVLYRNTISADGAPERQICGRLFAPLEAMPEAIDLMLGALIECGLAQAASLARRVLM